MAANDLPKSIYLYRDLNGTLVMTENPETIPDVITTCALRAGSKVGVLHLKRHSDKASSVLNSPIAGKKGPASDEPIQARSCAIRKASFKPVRPE